MRQTLYDLGLTEDDFKVEIILVDAEYIDPDTFSPKIKFTAKVDGVKCNLILKLSRESIHDLHLTCTNIDVEKEIEKIMKTEAIDWYVNNIKIIRKLKIEKLNRIYESR